MGRSFDEDLLRDLPADIDPCGENGEFHTFVHDGTICREPVRIKLGRVEGRGRFWFRELEAAKDSSREKFEAALASLQTSAKAIRSRTRASPARK